MKEDIIPFYTPSDKVIVKSEDCYLYDSEGNKYIDFESGVWCSNIGHGNGKINSVIEKQINETIHHGYYFRNKLAEQLSLKLQELIGFKGGASVFLSSGSEAVNLAITLARYFTSKRKILKIHNSYLSAFGFGLLSNDNESLVNIKYNDLEAIDQIDFSDISALVIETGGASVDMVKFPDNDFVNKLIACSQKNKCLIIAEEVTTGMGRMGKWFGFQHYDFTPDMVVAGKALGNGYPISSVILNSTLADKFRQNSFRYAQSHQNDPLGCAIALEVIKTIETHNLIERASLTGEYFKTQLENLRSKYPEGVKETRTRGLMLAIELYDSINGAAISEELFENGFVAGFKLNTFRFLPPLTIKHSDIDQLIGKLDEILSRKRNSTN
ncbi:aspartate aminotransferase family protein [Prolixibacteraceae bacterium JC049]|nr:aspartate aminotransferase family protein [Prolixibacteraceae bacterium JC049]